MDKQWNTTLQLGAAVGVGIMAAVWIAPLLSQLKLTEEERQLLRASLKMEAKQRAKKKSARKYDSNAPEKSTSDADTESETEYERESHKVRYLTNVVEKLLAEKKKHRGSLNDGAPKRRGSINAMPVSEEEAEDWGTRLTEHHNDVMSGDWEGFSMEDARKHNEMIGAASKMQTPREVLGELQVWHAMLSAVWFCSVCTCCLCCWC